MNHPTPIAATLTDEQLATVVELAATEPIQAIIDTWRYIDPEWDSREPRSVRPGNWTLPTSQWNAICSALANYRPSGALGAVNLAMDWVNVGPSSRDDDQ